MNWERGYRCHGLWQGIKRLGAVGLPPFGPVQEYRWTVDRTMESGKVSTLRRAKQEVEKRVMGNATTTRPALKCVWLEPLAWQSMHVPGDSSTLYCYRMELGGGFFLHVNSQLLVGRTYTATVKHAGGLNVSRSGFRKRGNSMVEWAKREARKYVRDVISKVS